MGKRLTAILLGCASLNAATVHGQPARPQNSQYSIVGRPLYVPHDQVVSGVKEVLLSGAQAAIRELGHDGGFLTNLNVRIPMPKQLKSLENTMRLLKQDQLADELVATMNHAAERAIPEAAPVLAEAISRMSLTDAEGIITGPPDAATRYFRQATETNLFVRFLPIVKRCTAQTGVTATYKRIEQAALANRYLGPLLSAVTDANSFDLDSYITEKALDGLFKEIAAQEELIRRDPVARTTELLRRLFGTNRQVPSSSPRPEQPQGSSSQKSLSNSCCAFSRPSLVTTTGLALHTKIETAKKRKIRGRKLFFACFVCFAV